MDDDSPPLYIEKDIEALAAPVCGGAIIERLDCKDSDVLDNNSQLDFDAALKCPVVNDKVAEIANELCQLRINQEQSKSIMKRHCTPENVKVGLPRCELSIWNEILEKHELMT